MNVPEGPKSVLLRVQGSGYVYPESTRDLFEQKFESLLYSELVGLITQLTIFLLRTTPQKAGSLRLIPYTPPMTLALSQFLPC